LLPSEIQNIKNVVLMTAVSVGSEDGMVPVPLQIDTGSSDVSPPMFFNEWLKSTHTMKFCAGMVGWINHCDAKCRSRCANYPNV
jgi:hypothetical protein